MTLRRLLPILLSFLAAPGLIRAGEPAPAFADDFESYAVVPPSTSILLPVAPSRATTHWLSKQDGQGRHIAVALDEAAHFGRGPANRVLELQRSAEAARDLTLLTHPFPAPVVAGRLRLRFYVAPGGIVGADSGFRLTLLGDVTTDIASFSTANTVTGIYFTDGKLHRRSHTKMAAGPRNEVPFTTGEAHALELVFNHTTAVLVYEGGILAPDSVDVWLDGHKRANWPLGSSTTAGTGVNGLFLLAPAGVANALHIQGALLIDELSLVPLATP